MQKLIEGIVASGVNVYDSDENIYRSAEYRDIVILTRSVTGWADTFADALMDRGIPAYTDSSTGYFSVREIQVILSMLTIVDNPVQGDKPRGGNDVLFWRIYGGGAWNGEKAWQRACR